MKKVIKNPQKKMLAGIKKLYDAVSSTLGPAGKPVLLSKKYGPPIVTKDGVSVANEIFLSDNVENDAVQLVKQVAKKTAELAGDGTTTATVIAYSIIQEGFKLIQAGAQPMELKRGIDKAVEAVVSALQEMAVKFDANNESEFNSFTDTVAEISANGDAKTGKLVAEAVRKSAGNGMVTVLESKTTEDRLEKMLGFEFNSGYTSQNFVNRTDRNECYLHSPLILVTNKRIVDISMIVHILEEAAAKGKPIVIVAEYFHETVLATMILQTIQYNRPMIAVKAPYFGDRKEDALKDIAIMTGTKVISDEMNLKLENVKIEELGLCEAISIKSDRTLIINAQGSQENILGLMQSLRAKFQAANTESEQKYLKERIAKISGGVSIIYVGGSSDAEVKEKKDRIDDAIHATNAAIEEGIVPGGGIALIRCIETLENLKGESADETMGINIVKNALQAPIKCIVENAGKESTLIVQKVLESPEMNFGYNARTGQYGNMIEMRVIDPVKVTRIALQNAASIGGLFLTTGCIVALEPQDEKPRL